MAQAKLNYTVAELNEAIKRFKSSYANVGGVTSTPSDVRRGKAFVDSSKSLKLGEMDNGAKIHGDPLVISDPLQLAAILNTSDESENGKIYRYDGETTAEYINGEFYVVTVAKSNPTEIPATPSPYLYAATSEYPNGSAIGWSSVTGAQGYYVYINGGLYSTTEATYFNLLSITTPGTYYVNVSAYNGLGTSAKSDTLTVKVVAAVIGGVILNVSVSGGSYTILEEPTIGGMAEIKISPSSGLYVPYGVTVAHNGVDISDDASKVGYARNNLEGTVALYDLKDGSYTVTGVCFDPADAKVEYDIYDGGLLYDEDPVYGQPWTCEIYAPIGYNLPDTVTVKIDGVATSAYSYSRDTGVLFIEKFRGYKVSVSGTCTKKAPNSVNLSMNVTATSLVFSWSAAEYATSYRLYMMGPGESSYGLWSELPSSSTSETVFISDIGGPGTYYFYVVGVNDKVEGARSNVAEYVLSDSSGDSRVSISTNIINGRASYATPTLGSTAIIVIVPDEGYAPPYSVSVTHDGTSVPTDEDAASYVRGTDSGILTIYTLNTGAYAVSGTCVLE